MYRANVDPEYHSRLLLDKSKKRKERFRLLDVPHDDGDMINV
jgi:hypothetical protein